MLTLKKFNSEPVYNKKILKTKIKFHGNEAAEVHDKDVPKAGSNHTCLAVIAIDFALKKENYYPQMFLKECKYIEEEVIRK